MTLFLNITGQRPNTHFNLTPPELIEKSLQRGEGTLNSTGALCATTGIFTGRSPKDKYIISDPLTEVNIDWKENKKMTIEQFENLLKKTTNYLKDKELFIFDGYAGADPKYHLPIRIINELAWHNLFAHQLFVRPTSDQINKHTAEFTVVSAPFFKANKEIDRTNSETVIAISFHHKIVLIIGTQYAGEIKKSIFSVVNYLLPDKKILPMHCSASINSKNNTALFFGLSGTGKTTLSATSNWRLIGDDEHGWSASGVFNIEGGCYAKCINLKEENEPQIWSAIKFGSVLENVVTDENRIARFDNLSLTENTRAAYPIEYIPNAIIPGISGPPKVIIFLTADAFGVLPPISKLTPEQAMYHFLSGYTSKLAGTERGVTEPETTFSSCFGAPFLPRPPKIYAQMLGEKIKQNKITVFMVNTGWTGGAYGVGNRISLKYTRAMVNAAVEGELDNSNYTRDNIFNFMIPDVCKDVPSELLNPRNTWKDKDLYDKHANELAVKFHRNFKEKFPDYDQTIINAGPRLN